MGERGDLLSRLRSVDEVLAGARPRRPHEARLLARLRAADRARQASSSSPSPFLALRQPWRALGVSAALVAVLALALHVRGPAPSPAAPTSRGDEIETPDLPTTRLSSTEAPPRPRAEAQSHRAPSIEALREPSPTPTGAASERPDEAAWPAPRPSAPWGSELPAPSPQLGSRDATPLATGGLEEPRVLWAEGHSGAAPRSSILPARRGQPTSTAPARRPDGCEAAEHLLDRARADCEAQALTLAERGLAYLDACGNGRFRGLDYACSPAPRPLPSSKAPAGCITEDLPADGACTTEDDLRLDALLWCDQAGLALAGLTLDQGGCSDGFQEARALCCEKDSDAPVGKEKPMSKDVCPDEGSPDCTK